MVRRNLSGLAAVGAVLAVAAGMAHAQSANPGGMPPPPGMSLAQSAAMRFPQPVRVGDLLRREVQRPVESQDVLGQLRAVVRDSSGNVLVVIGFGGFLGFGSRPIAVPIDVMVLLGQDMEVVAFTPDQLGHFPTFSPSGTTPIADDAVIKVGLANPLHWRWCHGTITGSGPECCLTARKLWSLAEVLASVWQLPIRLSQKALR